MGFLNPAGKQSVNLDHFLYTNLWNITMFMAKFGCDWAMFFLVCVLARWKKDVLQRGSKSSSYLIELRWAMELIGKWLLNHAMAYRVDKTMP